MCDTAARVVYIVDMWSKLCAQAGESAGVGNVGARLVSTTAAASTGLATSTATLATSATALAATASTTELATALATTTASFAATEFTAATTTALAATATALTTTASSTSTTLTRGRSKHAVAVELDVDLFLALALTLGLGSLAGHVSLLLFTGQSLALGELLAATLVGLANVLSGKGELLLGLLNEVGSIRHALVLRLRLGLVLCLSSIGNGVLLFGLGNGLASLLVF
jgi:hypothetical protein